MSNEPSYRPVYKLPTTIEGRESFWKEAYARGYTWCGSPVRGTLATLKLYMGCPYVGCSKKRMTDLFYVSEGHRGDVQANSLNHLIRAAKRLKVVPKNQPND